DDGVLVRERIPGEVGGDSDRKREQDESDVSEPAKAEGCGIHALGDACREELEDRFFQESMHHPEDEERQRERVKHDSRKFVKAVRLGSECEEIFEIGRHAADRQRRPDEVPPLAKRQDGGDVRGSERHLLNIIANEERYLHFRFLICDSKTKAYVLAV